MTAYDIIKRPVITEKSEMLRREYNKYTFEVNTKANKIQIRKAVEEIFNVKVESVSTLNSKPVVKRHGMKLYKTQAKKKAIVKLAQVLLRQREEVNTLQKHRLASSNARCSEYRKGCGFPRQEYR